MNLQQSLNHYYQALTRPDKTIHDPRLNTYFLDIPDLVLLIKQQVEDAINQKLIPAIQFKIHCLKEDVMAFIMVTITGGLDDFPVYKASVIKKWLKQGIPGKNGLIETAWYSKEFQCLEKILSYFVEKYNYATNNEHFAAKRYWTMSEISEDYEEKLMLIAVQKA